MIFDIWWRLIYDADDGDDLWDMILIMMMIFDIWWRWYLIYEADDGDDFWYLIFDDDGGGGDNDDGADIKGWTTQIPTLHNTNELFEHVWSHLNLRICFPTTAIYAKERKHNDMCDIRLLSVKVDYTTQILNKVKPL